VDPLARAAPAIGFEAVTTVFDDHVVLHRLNWQVRPGVVTVLMGPSGCGKTTLVRHLVGLRPPDAGRVLVGDDGVWELSAAARREALRSCAVLLGGSTPYSGSTFASVSVLENVRYALTARGTAPYAAEARAQEIIERLGLAAVAHLEPDRLAARTRRRAALAAALAADVGLFVLDEVDAAVDGVHARAVAGAILEAKERTGATVLVATHDLGLAREIADDVAVLCHGRIVTCGPVEEILAGVHSAEEFDRRFRVMDFLGPPDLERARAATRSPETDRSVVLDPALLLPLLVLALAAAVLTMLLGEAGSLGNL
jgi:phospholipid/cholesterol/gamma-HCH transport system ATP-binding protein